MIEYKKHLLELPKEEIIVYLTIDGEVNYTEDLSELIDDCIK